MARSSKRAVPRSSFNKAGNNVGNKAGNNVGNNVGNQEGRQLLKARSPAFRLRQD